MKNTDTLELIAKRRTAQDDFKPLCAVRLIQNLRPPFMPAVRTTIHGSSGTNETGQKGESSLPCRYVSGTASGAFHGIGRLCAAVFLLLHLGSELRHLKIIFHNIRFL